MVSRKWKKNDETDNYKYLGVYLSRNLKPTHHILKYLKENLENKQNGMVRILGKHGDYNRVEFGNAKKYGPQLYAHVLHIAVRYGFRRRKRSVIYYKSYNSKRQKLFYVHKFIFL